MPDSSNRAAERVLRQQLSDPRTLAEAEQQLTEVEPAPPLPPELIEAWVRRAVGEAPAPRRVISRQLLAAAALLIVLLAGSLAWAGRRAADAGNPAASHEDQFAAAIDAAGGAAGDEQGRIKAVQVLSEHCNYALMTLRGVAQNDAELAEAATAAIAAAHAALTDGGKYRQLQPGPSLLDACTAVSDPALTLDQRREQLLRLRYLTERAAVGLHEVEMTTQEGQQFRNDALELMRSSSTPPPPPPPPPPQNGN
ncbi:MAG: hypothetical protein H6838_13855 [Planctomycetes bacterium]|nr:hypothetical protein [Planctomycetota bacterium]MCB9886574.1 hypothetical protein [Planctomycetota bacterium]